MRHDEEGKREKEKRRKRRKQAIIVEYLWFSRTMWLARDSIGVYL